MSYADKLAELDDAFNEAEKVGAGGHPPYGVHQAKLTAAKLGTLPKGKNKGATTVSFTYKLQSGQNAYKNLVLTADNSMVLGILKGDLEVLGHKIKTLRELPGASGVLRKIVGSLVEVNIKQNKDERYYSVYVNKLLDEIGEQDEIADLEELEDEDDEEEVVELEEEEEEEEEPAPKPRPKKKKRKKSSKKASSSASKPIIDEDDDEEIGLEGFGEDDESFDISID